MLCKWVSNDMKTINNTCWEVGIAKELFEEGNLELCRKGLFHYFPHPLLAVMLKERNGCRNYSKLYEVVPEGKIVEGIDKCGATKLTLVKELEIPKLTPIQYITFAILAVLEGYKEPRFIDWANSWLRGEDRSYEAAAAVSKATITNIDNDNIAAFDVIFAAAYAAHAMSGEAFSFSHVTRASYAKDALYYTGNAIFYGIAKIKRDKVNFDLISLAKRAMEVQ